MNEGLDARLTAVEGKLTVLQALVDAGGNTYVTNQMVEAASLPIAVGEAFAMTDEEQRQSDLRYFAAHCPITLSECKMVAELEAGESLMDAYAQLRWAYALKMVDSGARP